jgi:streptogramin lyase
LLTLNRTGTSAYVGSARFPSEITAGAHTLSVTAYTQTAGQGQSVATASLTPTIVAGQTNTVDVSADLASTIANIVIDGQPLGVLTNGTLQLTGHAVDSLNNTMLLPAGALTWSIVSGSQYGSLTSAGLLTAGGTAATMNVSLNETGAAKSTSANVTITAPNPVDHLVIDNQPLIVDAGSTLQLAGHAVDVSGNTVPLPASNFSWTVTGGASYGSTTTAGLFTGIAGGTSQVTLTESSSHKNAAANVTVNPLVTVYVADYYNNRLTKMTSMAGANWTTYATGAATPACIAFDTQGRIYWTTDQSNTVCRADDITGKNLVTFGAFGSGTNQFNSPFGIAIDASNRIYIADSGNNRIVRMDDMSGTNWTTLGTSGTGTDQFTTPQGVAIGPSGKIYVADTMNFRIVRMDDMSGTNWTTLGTSGTGTDQFTTPQGVAIGPSGKIYVADTMNFRIVRMDDMTGTNWTALGSVGSGIDQFDGPIGVFVDTSERILVADTANDRIVRFTDMTGSGWTAFGSTGSNANQFEMPYSVCVDSIGRVYVADMNNDRVVRFAGTLDGTGWVSLGGPNSGTGADQFSDPMGIAVR